MKRRTLSMISRMIPKKWCLLLGGGLTVYIIFTHVFIHNTTPARKISDDGQNIEVPNVNPTARRFEGNAEDMGENKGENEELNQIPKVPVFENQDNPVEDLEKMIIRQREENEGDMQGRVLLPAVIESPEVKIPHLYFNKEGLDPNGMGVIVNRTHLNDGDKQLYDQGYDRNNFNEYVSNLISVDRSVPEARDPLCLNETYPSDLPDTSVIITFLNEAWSVLVRSVHSIINTTPPHLLKEIILVDDNSEYDHLKAPLEVYMKKFPKVRIIRNSQREGLIRSRLNGAEVATGQVLTFLDSHIECATGWLPPLLARIKESSSHVVWPAIPIIDRHTFKFSANRNAADLQMGVFNWQLTFHWEVPRVEERETVISPIKSPTMAGGLFSIDREYFYHIGSYDEEMRFWGAENLEISFRVWMCGGTVEVIPCSIIGHVYREKNVNAKGQAISAVTVNSVRLAMVWLDEYKYLYSLVTGVKLENYGDITSRLELRRKLNCKSFDWYLNNVYPAAFIPKHAKVSGLVHSVHNSSVCLQAVDSKDSPVQVGYCNSKDFRRQVFYKTDFEEIRLISNCLDAGQNKPIIFPCHKMKGNQHFQYRQDHTIFHPGYGKCFQWKDNTNAVELAPCDGSARQMWVWEHVPLDFLNSDQSVHH